MSVGFISTSEPPVSMSIVNTGDRFVRSRQIEKPPRFGEKPYAQLVENAFDGHVLTLSKRLRLLEEATNRGIRRGDALDVIASEQRRREKKHRIRHRSATELFIAQYVAFAAGYIALAGAWCAVLAMS